MIYGYRYNPKNKHCISFNTYKYGTDWKHGQIEKISDTEHILYLEGDDPEEVSVVGHLKTNPKSVRHWPRELRMEYKDLILKYVPSEFLKQYPFLIE